MTAIKELYEYLNLTIKVEKILVDYKNNQTAKIIVECFETVKSKLLELAKKDLEYIKKNDFMTFVAVDYGKDVIKELKGIVDGINFN